MEVNEWEGVTHWVVPEVFLQTSESCRCVLTLTCGLKNKRAVSTQLRSRHLRTEDTPAREQLGGELGFRATACRPGLRTDGPAGSMENAGHSCSGRIVGSLIKVG